MFVFYSLLLINTIKKQQKNKEFQPSSRLKLQLLLHCKDKAKFSICQMERAFKRKTIRSVAKMVFGLQ